MVSNYVRLAKDTSETQENLNPQQSTFPILIRSEETLVVEEGPTIIKTNDVSDMAIWDNPQTTWDGVDTDDEWDSYNTTSEVIVRVVNPRQTFVERFAFTTLQGANNTATWDTTNKDVDFTSGQILEIVSAFKDSSSSQIVSAATLNVTIDSGSFDFELSADGGSNWESVTNGVQHTFTNTGSDLRIRVTENNSSTGTITLVRCSYVI